MPWIYLLKTSLIKVLIKYLDLIISLTCIKTGNHIGFYKSIEIQIIKSTFSKSDFQK